MGKQLNTEQLAQCKGQINWLVYKYSTFLDEKAKSCSSGFRQQSLLFLSIIVANPQNITNFKRKKKPEISLWSILNKIVSHEVFFNGLEHILRLHICLFDCVMHK